MHSKFNLTKKNGLQKFYNNTIFETFIHYRNNHKQMILNYNISYRELIQKFQKKNISELKIFLIFASF